MDKNKMLKDLITDPSFLNWVKQSDKKDVAKWDSWSKDNPERVALLKDAKVLVEGFSFKKEVVSDEQINKNWKDFAAQIDQTPPQKAARIFSYRQVLKIAAVLLIGVIGILSVKNWVASTPPELIVFQTAPDETNTFKLPDGSMLHLNTNSKVTLYDNFLSQKERVLELEGEAYFEVFKQAEGKTFQVKTKDLTVKVVGTAFNVNSKRELPIVSLVEGTVNLLKNGFAEKTLIPGQTARFNNAQNAFEISTNQTDYWKSWTNHKWAFGTGTPMQEVLDRIEETFGLTCQVKNTKILEKRASGEVSVENKDILFEALSVLLDLNFKEQNGQLIITPLE